MLTLVFKTDRMRSAITPTYMVVSSNLSLKTTLNTYWCSTCVQLVHETLVPRVDAVFEQFPNTLKKALFTQALLGEKEF